MLFDRHDSNSLNQRIKTMDRYSPSSDNLGNHTHMGIIPWANN